MGNCVTNAIFHFDKGAPIIEKALQMWNEKFNPRGWASGGPDLLQRALLDLCGFEKDHTLRFDMTRERFSRSKCQGIKLLDYKSFFPVGWMNQVKYFQAFKIIYLQILKVQFWEPKRTKSDWYTRFKHSYGVHFYHSSSQNAGPSNVVKSPRLSIIIN